MESAVVDSLPNDEEKLNTLKEEIKAGIKEINTKSVEWETRLLGQLKSSTKGKQPLVSGFKDKTTIVPLARLQMWVENQIQLLNEQNQAGMNNVFQMVQYLNQQLVDNKAGNLALDIKSEALQRLSKIDDKVLKEMMDVVTKEREAEVEASKDKAEGRVLVERACVDKDTVKIDFEGKIDGVVFSGGSSTNHQLTLGTNSMIPGFEEGILGMSAGDVKDVAVTFPEDYGNKEVAGKDAIFTITVHSVKEKVETVENGESK